MLLTLKLSPKKSNDETFLSNELNAAFKVSLVHFSPVKGKKTPIKGRHYDLFP